MSEIPFKGEIRRDYLTGSDVIFTLSRDTRPRDFRNDESLYGNKTDCQFEYGKESFNTTIKTVGKPWKLRLMYNKYPIVNSGVESFLENGFLKKYSNYGKSYVVVDTPNHSMKFHEIDNADLYEWFKLLIEGEKMMYEDKKIKHVYVFKNSGSISGGSIYHQHTQIIGLPFILPVIKQDLLIIKENHNKCIIEDAIKIDKERILIEDKYALAFSPFGSRFKGMSIITVKRHINHITKLNDAEILSIINMLKEILKRNEKIFGAHSYNIMFHEMKSSPELHLYLEITPRFSNIGSMELSGVFMNSLRPEVYVKKFRDAV
jgi:UDPglucose--hexose-1-phosphate uridylyltransferase